jgi:hypothetical protein
MPFWKYVCEKLAVSYVRPLRHGGAKTGICHNPLRKHFGAVVMYWSLLTAAIIHNNAPGVESTECRVYSSSFF